MSGSSKATAKNPLNKIDQFEVSIAIDELV